MAAPNSCFGRNRKKYMIYHNKFSISTTVKIAVLVQRRFRNSYFMFYLNFYTKMIVRLKQLKEMNIKVALMYVIVCECDLYECH